MVSKAKSGQAEDFRVRVARERRDRMRHRLRKAVVATCAAQMREDLPTVEDVILEAKVSRATFYKYFNSVEEVVGIVGHILLEDIMKDLKQLCTDNDSPIARLTMMIQLFTFRSLIDKPWAAFVFRTAHMARETLLQEFVNDQLKAARQAGLMKFHNVQSAVSLLIGSIMEAIWFISRADDPSRDYCEELFALILRGLGIKEDMIANIVQDRAIYVRGLAPDKFTWWRDPWATNRVE